MRSESLSFIVPYLHVLYTLCIETRIYSLSIVNCYNFCELLSDKSIMRIKAWVYSFCLIIACLVDSVQYSIKKNFSEISESER